MMNLTTEFFTTPLAAIGSVVTIVGAASAAFKSGRQFWLNFGRYLLSKPVLPRETLRVMQSQDDGHNFWSEGMAGIAT
jgi:hypothetical protein